MASQSHRHLSRAVDRDSLAAYLRGRHANGLISCAQSATVLALNNGLGVLDTQGRATTCCFVIIWNGPHDVLEFHAAVTVSHGRKFVHVLVKKVDYCDELQYLSRDSSNILISRSTGEDL